MVSLIEIIYVVLFLTGVGFAFPNLMFPGNNVPQNCTAAKSIVFMRHPLTIRILNFLTGLKLDYYMLNEVFLKLYVCEIHDLYDIAKLVFLHVRK